jgi:Fungal Zn(2)-Cys(6) binuclear cluster domain
MRFILKLILARKLKCDGGRPACGQCHKRSNPCDYIPHSKRRGAGRARKPQEDDSGSELDSGEEAEPEPSHSPDVLPSLASRANSNGNKELSSSARPSSIRHAMTHPEHGPRLSPVLQPKPLMSENGPHHFRTFSSNQDLPPIATLPVTSTPTPATENIPVLPPILIPESHQQSMQQPQPQQLGRPRKRSSTTSGRGSRSHYASKIVACNFCRGVSLIILCGCPFLTNL